MNVLTLKHAHALWCVDRAGPESGKSSNWRYYQTVLYYNNFPNRRFMTAADGRKVCLCRGWYRGAVGDSIPTRPKPSGIYDQGNKLIRDNAFLRWDDIPEIGCHSRYDDDMLTERDTHERLAYVFLQEVRHFIADYVDKITMPQLEKDASLLLATVDQMYARHHNYSVIFGLNWDELPKIYRQNIADEIGRRIKRYHDPKAEMARKRTHARKIAKKAFRLS